jgi:hypothetical protein
MGLKFRRGSTAQQSGSLAFGEPYVNTTLGTLVVGGATGDIVLSAGGTGSTGNFGAISGSGLDITGNANIAGNLTLGGNITIGDNTSDTVAMTANLSSSIIPSLTNTFDLGSPSKQWRHLYISTGSIYMNGTAILSSNATDLTLTTDVGQSLKLLETSADTITLQTADGNLTFASSGGGDVVLDPNTGVISLKGTVQVQDGNKITSSGGNTIQFANGVGITGSLRTTSDLTVGGNFVVNGTTTTIDSTNINIGDNIIVLNGTVTTNGGIYVKDGAGASTLTGSFLWDTTNDKWIAGTLGNEIGILRVGGDSVVSSSTQVIGILSSLNTYTSSNDTTITNLNTTTASLNTSVSNLNSFSSSQLTQNTALATISGSLISTASANTISVANLNAASSSYETKGRGIVSGSSQIVYASISSIPSGIVSGSSQIAFSGVTGTVSNAQLANSAVTVTAGTGLSGGGAVSLGSSVTLNNAGVTSNVAGTGISVSGATGAVTITNTGVTSAVAGTGVSVSGATGAVTISIGQAVATSSDVRFNSLGIGMAASTTAGRIDASGDIVAYSTSDKNFKENITPIANALDKISKISGNTYDWKADMKEFHGFEGNDVGVIAQEIEEVLPQLVTTRETGYKAVKYDKLVALLIEGIKEQQQQIHSLTIEVQELKKTKGL